MGKVAQSGIILKASGNFQASHAWHPPIQQHGIERTEGEFRRLNLCQCLFSRSGGMGFQTPSIQNLLQNNPGGFLVIHRKNFAIFQRAQVAVANGTCPHADLNGEGKG